MRVGTSIKQSTLLVWRDALNGGALQCMVGTPPTGIADAVDSGDIIVSVPAGMGTVATVGDTVTLTVDPDPVLSGNAGTVGWVRAVTSAGAVVFDALAGLPGSGAAAILSSLNIDVGGEADPRIVLTL